MKHRTTRTLASLALLGATLPAIAVPARPGTFTRTQPDGTVVTLSMHGDERFHYMTDTDGYIVAKQADGWYRILDNEGNATSLVPMAKNIRSEADLTELMLINPQKSFEALKTRSIASSPFAMYKAPGMYKASKVSASKWDNADGHDLREIPTDGERHVLVILVNFSDLKWSFANDPQAEMTAMLNQPGYTGNYCTGSVADYFRESSNGVYKPIFDVYGPVELNKPYSYYGRNDSSGTDSAPWEMVTDACAILDPDVDFSIYDTNDDGLVDNVYVFYAGFGENEGVGADYVWPHSFNLHWQMQCPEYDGVKIDHYACSNELTKQTIDNNPKTHSGIGTFCHEFSHVLGLPDLYATSYTGAITPGEFSLMDHGSYNNNSRTPPLYSIYEKYALEWEKPIDITEGANINMQPTVDGGHAYRITIDPSKPKEYYLFENRQKHGWDSYIPGHGMLVWHIDFDSSVWNDNIVNNTPEHQHVDLIEADGAVDDGTRSGDPFPGTATCSEFIPSAAMPYPSFSNWNGTASKLPITSIGEDETGLISFKAGDGGSADSHLNVDKPTPILTGIDNTSMSLEWKPVAGATAYYLTVMSMYVDDLFGTLETTLLDDYTFADLGDKTSAKITGLEPGRTYSISLNAGTDQNLSPSGTGMYTTFDQDFSNASPILEVAPGTTDATLKWIGVPEADYYEATVATRTMGEAEPGITIAWDNRRYPSDWSFPGGSFDTRDDYVGETSPSLRLVNGTVLSTGLYDNDIRSISMWARSGSTDAPASLKFYSVEPNYSLTPIAEISDLACSKEGTKVEIKNIPDGVKQFMMIYSCPAAGITANIDDIQIDFAGAITDTPVGGYDARRVDGTSLKAEGLAPLTDYVAYVHAIKGESESAKSKTVYFSTADPSGIDSATATGSAFTLIDGVAISVNPMDIFSIDGTPVAIKATGSVRLPGHGIYLIRADGKTSKVIW